jgi:hypothetical protein
MTAIVSVETVLLVLLVVLVAGLLRSHAEILRRLGIAESERDNDPSERNPDQSTDPAAGLPQQPARDRRPDELRVAPLTGVTPDGDAVALELSAADSRPTLLAFLSSGCSTCVGFWETLGEPRLPAAVRTVIVTHGAERERRAQLRRLAPSGVPVVMSSDAWRDYSVPGSPYFVLVDGWIRGEGVATSWDALASLVSDAIEDQHEHAPGRGRGGPGRARDVDATLAAAGIGPDHESLYPAGRPPPR